MQPATSLKGDAGIQPLYSIAKLYYLEAVMSMARYLEIYRALTSLALQPNNKTILKANFKEPITNLHPRESRAPRIHMSTSK
jgi:hypothetical protein